jgi:ABC-2 type transport system ATP-binding protein
VTYGLNRVTVRFGTIAALSNVTMTAAPGDVTMVVGGDGAGKTTLLRTLVGLVGPNEGTVARPPARETGFLPTGAGSWRNLTVDQNMSFVGAAFGLTASEITDRGGKLLDRAGLAQARSRLAGQLSGGMRNKLGFCLAALSSPELLVLDEPTTGVDPVSRVDLWRLISEAAASGTTVVMATTYMDEAERASIVYLLDSGRVLGEGPPDALITGMQGAITVTDEPEDRTLAWRVGRTFRQWWPDGVPSGIVAVAPTLEDAAIVARLHVGLTTARDGS